MTIRDIFRKADPQVVNDFFCDVPISELRDEWAYSICQGLQYAAQPNGEATTEGGEKLSKQQMMIIARHFEAQLQMVYEALEINSDDKDAAEKLNEYLDQEVETKEGETANDTAIRLIWEMNGMSRFHLRYIDRIRATTDHATLRRWLQETEAAIKAIVGDDPLHYYMNYPKEADIDKLHHYLGIRRMLLDRMFTYSDEEVKRFEQVNELLADLSKQMYHRTADLYRTILRCGADETFDDDYEVEGTLNAGVEYDPEDGDYDTVLHLHDDDYYGSDFAYMLYVVAENDEKSHYGLDNIEECSISHNEENTPDMTDKELNCDWEFLNDGDSWIDFHRHPKFDHICVCHALHSMFDHHEYSLADILRVNSFWVEAKIKCQRITDQQGRRYHEIRG